jgi:hypothetical protein
MSLTYLPSISLVSLEVIVDFGFVSVLRTVLTVVRAIFTARLTYLYPLVRKYAYVIIVGPILTKYG